MVALLAVRVVDLRAAAERHERGDGEGAARVVVGPLRFARATASLIDMSLAIYLESQRDSSRVLHTTLSNPTLWNICVCHKKALKGTLSKGCPEQVIEHVRVRHERGRAHAVDDHAEVARTHAHARLYSPSHIYKNTHTHTRSEHRAVYAYRAFSYIYIRYIWDTTIWSAFPTSLERRQVYTYIFQLSSRRALDHFLLSYIYLYEKALC